MTTALVPVSSGTEGGLTVAVLPYTGLASLLGRTPAAGCSCLLLFAMVVTCLLLAARFIRHPVPQGR